MFYATSSWHSKLHYFHKVYSYSYQFETSQPFYHEPLRQDQPFVAEAIRVWTFHPVLQMLQSVLEMLRYLFHLLRMI